MLHVFILPTASLRCISHQWFPSDSEASSRVGDERDHAPDDGDQRLLQPREARRVYVDRRHPVDGGDDPPRWRAQRHTPASQTAVQHLQLHATLERVHRQDLQQCRRRLLHPGTIAEGGNVCRINNGVVGLSMRNSAEMIPSDGAT